MRTLPLSLFLSLSRVVEVGQSFEIGKARHVGLS